MKHPLPPVSTLSILNSHFTFHISQFSIHISQFSIHISQFTIAVLAFFFILHSPFSIALAFPPAPVAQTGQTTCYSSVSPYSAIPCTDTGQDGEFRAGWPWPNPRFTDNSLVSSADQSVTDNLTGLIWTKDANLMKTRDPSFDADGMVTWQSALDYVAKLNTENYLGHNDWRLPNVNEMKSLVNAEKSSMAT